MRRFVSTMAHIGTRKCANPLTRVYTLFRAETSIDERGSIGGLKMLRGGTGQERTLVLTGLEKIILHTTNIDLPTVYAARIVNIGVTAYGNTSKEAEDKLQVALNTYANKLYRNGILGKRLAVLGIHWYWADTPGWVTESGDGHASSTKSERLLVTA